MGEIHGRNRDQEGEHRGVELLPFQAPDLGPEPEVSPTRSL
jgi:hypothetical protein